MKFKLDENLPIEAAKLLVASGYDAHTVLQEGLGGGAGLFDIRCMSS